MPVELSRRTLLVVEDNDGARESLACLLGRENFRVVAVQNGIQALNYLRSGERPALILLDMLLPVLDGWHFLEAIRRETPPLHRVLGDGKSMVESSAQPFPQPADDTPLMIQRVRRHR